MHIPLTKRGGIEHAISKAVELSGARPDPASQNPLERHGGPITSGAALGLAGGLLGYGLGRWVAPMARPEIDPGRASMLGATVGATALATPAILKAIDNARAGRSLNYAKAASLAEDSAHEQAMQRPPAMNTPVSEQPDSPSLGRRVSTSMKRMYDGITGSFTDPMGLVTGPVNTMAGLVSGLAGKDMPQLPGGSLLSPSMYKGVETNAVAKEPPPVPPPGAPKEAWYSPMQTSWQDETRWRNAVDEHAWRRGRLGSSGFGGPDTNAGASGAMGEYARGYGAPSSYMLGQIAADPHLSLQEKMRLMPPIQRADPGRTGLVTGGDIARGAIGAGMGAAAGWALGHTLDYVFGGLPRATQRTLQMTGAVAGALRNTGAI